MSVALRVAEDTDRSDLVAQLRDLVALLDRTPRLDALSPLVHDCNAALEESLGAARDRDGDHDPRSPTSRELAWLTEMMLVAEPQDLVVIMRQIRRLLGRIDTHAGGLRAGMASPSPCPATA